MSDKNNEAGDNGLMALTADVVSSFLANNTTLATEIPGLIKSVYYALSSLSNVTEDIQEKQEPAVSVRSSVKHDYIVCLEDGAKLKMLKRYLRTNFDLSPDQYRAKWGLPRDYPMVAPAYAQTRRDLAVRIGLGRKRFAEPTATPTQKTKT